MCTTLSHNFKNITQKGQNHSCDTIALKRRYVSSKKVNDFADIVVLTENIFIEYGELVIKLHPSLQTFGPHNSFPQRHRVRNACPCTGQPPSMSPGCLILYNEIELPIPLKRLLYMKYLLLFKLVGKTYLQRTVLCIAQ